MPLSSRHQRDTFMCRSGTAKVGFIDPMKTIPMRRAFTLIELLVVVAIIAVLSAVLFPLVSRAKAAAGKTMCASNMRQLSVSSLLYMGDNDGALFHHHEDWVLDDGTLTQTLPPDPDGCVGGGFGNSQAEKPWAVFFYPYSQSREIAFSPADTAPRSQKLARTLEEYNGGNEVAGAECDVDPDAEACLVLRNNWSPWSYLLNSIFTHKSCRYATEGVLSGFATEGAIAALDDPNVILFSTRNSEGFSDPDSGFYYPLQDDYDTWAGEAALVRWGKGSRPNEGWIKYDRHGKGSNYIFADGHVKFLHWGRARVDQYPDKKVRYPLADPPR